MQAAVGQLAGRGPAQMERSLLKPGSSTSSGSSKVAGIRLWTNSLYLEHRLMLLATIRLYCSRFRCSC